MTFPNQLSILRLFCAPVLLVLAWFGKENAFLILLVFAFFLDAIDGPIARRFHQETEFGSKMDSYADTAIYIVFIAGACWLWPEIIRREIVYVLIIIGSLLLPGAASFFRFYRLVSYHTWLIKLAAVCTTVSGIVLFMNGPPYFFRAASFLCLLGAIEEIIITLVLKEPYSNVKTLWHVLRKQRREM